MDSVVQSGKQYDCLTARAARMALLRRPVGCASLLPCAHEHTDRDGPSWHWESPG